VRDKTMASFLEAFLNAGFSLERVVELTGGGAVLPRTIAIVASKTHSPGLLFSEA